MKVLKFGGTSVGSVESILSVKQIVEACQEPVVVVVSALGGITDRLLAATQMAITGDTQYRTEIEGMITRHKEVIEGVVMADRRAYVTKETLHLFDELSNIYKGLSLLGDHSPRTLATIVSYGERISSMIVANTIKDAVWKDSRSFIKTYTDHGKYLCDTGLTNRLISEEFATIPKVSLVPGFISTDRETGEITNLGRGGSDYTAAILAAELNATALEIWTDVDGFMTADPRVIRSAYVIDELAFVEAMELCNFGAKVIYPPTIYPVFHKRIPIWVKNTFNPSARGTYIAHDIKSDKPIKGISSINDTSLITVMGPGMVGVVGVSYRLFRALASSGVNVIMISQASSENTVTMAVRDADATAAVTALNDEFISEINSGEINRIKAQQGLATVAIVGENMKSSPGIAGKLFTTLGRSGISVIACAQGASETNISFVIEGKDLRKALNAIHESFFLSSVQKLNIFLVGTGTVGGSLLDQIKMQQPKLIEQNGVKLNVIGIADIDHVIINRDGVDLDNYQSLLNESSLASTPEVIINQLLHLNIFNAVFVDCTASPKIAALYEELLGNNISVVAANKIAASGPYDHYTKLKDMARKRGVKFLIETNVGAGLPIINTMGSLINSGDKILKLEAVLSGTLNFIFNTFSADIPFSRAIKMAQEARFAEPDPRIDLSGTDVIRKLVILARESGYVVEQADVEKNLFVPSKYFEGSLDEFWATIEEMDAPFEEQRKRLEAEHKRYRFVAKMEHGKCSVSLKEVDSSHPFYDLEGSNNIITIQTERYFQDPMIIKGYGAGAAVTAAGVFGDIISIANIR